MSDLDSDLYFPQCKEYAASALEAVASGESWRVPQELATLLCLGGDRGVSETCREWLLKIGSLRPRREEVAPCFEELAGNLGLDDKVVEAALELLDEQVPSLLVSAGWRDLELGERTEVLMLLAHLVRN